MARKSQMHLDVNTLMTDFAAVPHIVFHNRHKNTHKHRRLTEHKPAIRDTLTSRVQLDREHGENIKHLSVVLKYRG